MTPNFTNYHACAQSSIIEAFIPADFHYIDNDSVCTILDHLYQYLNTAPNITMEGSIALMNGLSIIFREAITYAVFNGTCIPHRNRKGIDAYFKDFIKRCNACMFGDQEVGKVFERDQIDEYANDDARTAYVTNVSEEYIQAYIKVNVLHYEFMEYPFEAVHNRSAFSRKHVNYGD